MRRALVIGSGGAGKSTFAARLARATGLPLIHLDAIHWNEGWVETPKQEWTRIVARLTEGESWVMDGNYGGTLDRRLEACDTVIFLDLPRIVCLWRVVGRRIRYHGISRPDMREGCPERLSMEFVKWIWEYPEKQRPKILRKLAALGEGNRVVLKSRGEVERFLGEVERFLGEVERFLGEVERFLGEVERFLGEVEGRGG